MNHHSDEKYCVTGTKTSQLGRFLIRLDTVKKDGKEYSYSYIVQKNSVGVLAFENDMLILIRQYRHSINSYEYEIPGGGIEKGEKPIDVAIHEMVEETGFAVDSIEELGFYYPSPGSSDEKCYLFVAQCHNEGKPKREPLEFITVELVTEEVFTQLIKTGQFKHSMGLVAWLKYLIKRG